VIVFCSTTTNRAANGTENGFIYRAFFFNIFMALVVLSLDFARSSTRRCWELEPRAAGTGQQETHRYKHSKAATTTGGEAVATSMP
jgi:hypothetical protein